MDLSSCSEELAPSDGVLLTLEELGPPVLSAVDLATGESSTVFEVPSQGFAYEFDVRGGDIVLAYTAPPEGGGDGYDRSVLVLLRDGELVPLAGEGTEDNWSFYPTWSADGASVWFVATGEDTEPTSVLARVDLATGSVSEVVAAATEPAVSPTSLHIAWVAVDPVTAERELVLGDSDGNALRTLVDADATGDLGQPFFSGDGQFVTFVVLEEPETEEAGGSLWDRLIPTAQAHANHDSVGDWWRVPVQGGEIERVSFLETIHYDGAPSVHGEAFVAATRDGVLRVDVATGTASTLRCLRTVRSVGLTSSVPAQVRWPGER